jgi:PEP-CTERM/exosortase A-associated glycosyltransferase
MKILHILDRSIPDLSGYSIRSKYIVEFQKKIGLEPTVLTSPKYPRTPESERINNITYYRSFLPQDAFSSIMLKIPFIREILIMEVLKKDIRRLVKIHQFDILHAHSPSLCGLAALRIAQESGIPFIYEARALWEDTAVDMQKFTEKSIKYKISRYLETRLFKRADTVIAICDNLKQEISSRIGTNHIYVVPNGVNTQEFIPKEKSGELINKYNLKGKTIVGFIGKFFRYEGLDILLKSIPLILAQNKNMIFILIGGGVEEANIFKMAKELKLDDSVIFPGWIPHEEILDYYSIIDIFVYPRVSKRITELVTPLKPLEAMAMGKMVVASNVGGLKELIKDRETGFLFSAGDSDDLAKKIVFLSDKDALRKEIGERARLAVLSERDWSIIVPNYRDIYNRLLSNKKKHENN